jgi:hypothetical protein
MVAHFPPRKPWKTQSDPRGPFRAHSAPPCEVTRSRHRSLSSSLLAAAARPARPPPRKETPARRPVHRHLTRERSPAMTPAAVLASDLRPNACPLPTVPVRVRPRRVWPASGTRRAARMRPARPARRTREPTPAMLLRPPCTRVPQPRRMPRRLSAVSGGPKGPIRTKSSRRVVRRPCRCARPRSAAPRPATAR